MEEPVLLLVGIGVIVGCLGTLIGAGGGFILVPVLLFMYPTLKPESITAVSMAIVCCNALSGTVAYARAGRIDYQAGIQFSICTIPGSILGVMATRYIPKTVFTVVFGGVMLLLALYLFFKKDGEGRKAPALKGGGVQERVLRDRKGDTFTYAYHPWLGWVISLVVGFISPILGIGGGIIHVPALINWLQFPVHIATATSHFILAVMSLVSVIVHISEGNYNDPHILRLVVCLGIGVIAGAQAGAYFSHTIKGRAITRALAFSLGLVSIRILLGSV